MINFRYATSKINMEIGHTHMNIPKKFRENRYLNESGSQTGNWFLNRLDYFQFHQYPKYKAHKFISLMICLLCVIVSLKIISVSLLAVLPFFYIGYIAAKTFYILNTRVCRHRGYFLYPAKIVKFFKAREIATDINDFDSIATLSKK